jgi:hypothetical protein
MEEYKFYLEANMTKVKETDSLKKEVASVIDLPSDDEKQPDLSYFSAIFVSSGENLNHAYFLGSELVAAENTVVSKALDVEHKEKDIIGHIFSSAFTDDSGSELSSKELAGLETAVLDTSDMHIQIGCIVYKSRFPELSKEIADDEWKVSMECFYKDFDIKVGDMIIPRTTAEAIGIETSDVSIYGKLGKIIKDGKEVASGEVARVLRGICFSGCGIVKNPANPPSVVLETADEKDDENEEVLFNLDIYIEVASENEDTVEEEKNSDLDEENITAEAEAEAEAEADAKVCPKYMKNLNDEKGSLLQEDWCTEYGEKCSSENKNSLDDDCLTNKITTTASSYINELFNYERSDRNIDEATDRLIRILDKARTLSNKNLRRK